MNMLERRPEEVIRLAVKGMLPAPPRPQQLTKLKVYAAPPSANGSAAAADGADREEVENQTSMAENEDQVNEPEETPATETPAADAPEAPEAAARPRSRRPRRSWSRGRSRHRRRLEYIEETRRRA